MGSVELLVPPTNTGMDWPRRVANAINATLRRVTGIESKIAVLKDEVEAVEIRVTAAEANIVEAQEDIDALEAAVTSIGRLSVRAVSASEAVGPDDELILVDATAAAATITLPVAETGRLIYVKKVDASANAVTIAADAGQAIDGAPTVSLATQWISFTLAGVPGGWAIL